jgi:hypothetical protein
MAQQHLVEVTHSENGTGNRSECRGMIPPKAGLDGSAGAGDIIHAEAWRVFSTRRICCTPTTITAIAGAPLKQVLWYGPSMGN